MCANSVSGRNAAGFADTAYQRQSNLKAGFRQIHGCCGATPFSLAGKSMVISLLPFASTELFMETMFLIGCPARTTESDNCVPRVMDKFDCTHVSICL